MARLIALLLIVTGFALASPAVAMSLQEAVKIALEANPEIGEAIANREATEFNLRKAVGRYFPEIDLEARFGAQNFDSPGTRLSGTSDDVLARKEANLVLSQLLFNGFGRRGEMEQQAARVDAASHRVYERSEVIALAVIHEYLEYGRLLRIIELAEENVRYHRKILGDLQKAAQEGTLSVADRQLAEERVNAAEAQLLLARQDLNAAAITFYKQVGRPLDSYAGAALSSGSLPASLEDGIGVARQNSPVVQVAEADLDAAYGLYKQANAELYPKLFLELRGRQGDDLDGVLGRERDLRAELIMRWNLFRGGIDISNKQETLRRIDEERFRLDRAYRDVEETVRLAWNRRMVEAQRLSQLESELSWANKLVESYQEQFKIGERTLLDLMNTVNTRFNTQVAVETSRFTVLFAGYGILAATGTLLSTLKLAPPSQAAPYARDAVRVPLTPEAETQKRFSPSQPILNRP